jgi:hypothetical protein
MRKGKTLGPSFLEGAWRAGQVVAVDSGNGAGEAGAAAGKIMREAAADTSQPLRPPPLQPPNERRHVSWRGRARRGTFRRCLRRRANARGLPCVRGTTPVALAVAVEPARPPPLFTAAGWIHFSDCPAGRNRLARRPRPHYRGPNGGNGGTRHSRRAFFHSLARRRRRRHRRRRLPSVGGVRFRARTLT